MNRILMHRIFSLISFGLLGFNVLETDWFWSGFWFVFFVYSVRQVLQDTPQD
jgi:hypothetical protein